MNDSEDMNAAPGKSISESTSVEGSRVEDDVASNNAPFSEPSGTMSNGQTLQCDADAIDPKAENLRKAAVLLASLPPADAAYLLRQLDETQLVEIVRAAKSQPFRSDEQIHVLREFTALRQRGMNASPSPPSRRIAATRESRKAFTAIAAAPPAVIVRLLVDELPQTIAVVLAHLAPALAAQVIERLPTEKQLATTLRIASLRTPDPIALSQMANVMMERFDELNSPPSSPIGGAAHVAQILRHTSSATEKALLANVHQEDADLVKSVSRHLSVLRNLNVDQQSGRIDPAGGSSDNVSIASNARRFSA